MPTRSRPALINIKLASEDCKALPRNHARAIVDSFNTK
jgi:hypothetical protein